MDITDTEGGNYGKKDVAETFAKNIFTSSQFQEKWNHYIAFFGDNIEKLFPNSYKTKVRFAATLQKICDKNYTEALRDLREYHSAIVSDDENTIISYFINICENNIPNRAYPQKSDLYMRYREMLFWAGFSEAKQKYGHFFRQATEQTAFVVNFEDDDETCITILYGFASTAYMIGDKEWFSNNGAYINDCQIRHILCVWDDTSEANAKTNISDFYEQYKLHSKDEILAVKKERQKVFIDHFARALKPLGFKKKATKWTKPLDNGKAITFEAQKSAFSDQYYFNVIVHNASNIYATHSYERVVMYGSDIYNWQLMTEEQIENLIQFALKNYINPKLN